MDLLHGILNVINTYPDRSAFIIEDKKYSYRFLGQRICAVSEKINSLNLPDPLIGIFALNDIDTYATILAILFSGKGYLPILPQNPLEKTLKILELSGISTIFQPTYNMSADQGEQFSSCQQISTGEIKASTAELRIQSVVSDQVAYLLFTSGSTGIPKGVPITRKNLDAFILAFNKIGYSIGEKDRCLQMFDLTFDFSVATYLTPLFKGASIYTVPQKGIKYNHILRLLLEEKLTVAPMVPSILNHIKPYFTEIQLEALKYCYFCGEALPEDILIEFSKCAPNSRFVNFYGPTEATVFSLAYEWSPGTGQNKSFNGIVSIGKPMDKLHALMINENGSPARKKGELCLAGPQVTPGYWKDDALNELTFFRKIIDDKEYQCYRTGDLVWMDPEGDYMFVGRLDQQIQIQGFRVEMGEIEHFTRIITGIPVVAAIAYKSDMGNLRIHLFLENYSGSVEMVKQHLAIKLPSYMVPEGISILEKIPLNQNGKIDRIALVKMAEE